MKYLTILTWISLLTITLAQTLKKEDQGGSSDANYSNCTWYCDRIKAWRNYGKEYQANFLFASPITPKWIKFYTKLLAKCLSNGALPDGETCTLRKLPDPVDPGCPNNMVNILGVCTECKADEVIENGKCVTKTIYGCPPNQKRVNDTCVDICPQGSHMVNGKCKQDCPKGQKLEKGKCVKTCPEHEHLVDGECVKKCEANQILVDGKCITKNPCPEEEVQIAGKCMRICPNGKEQVGLLCKDKTNPCKLGQMKKSGKCEDICPKRFYLKKGQCHFKPEGCHSKKQCIMHWIQQMSKTTNDKNLAIAE
jgi:hypothetical protein